MADIFDTVFAKKTKFTVSICKLGNTVVQSKVSHESYLHMETIYKVRITISNGPELIGGNVLKTCLSHSHAWMVTAKTKPSASFSRILVFTIVFQFEYVGKVNSLNHNSR